MSSKISGGIERRGPAQYRARFRRFDDQGVKTLDQSKTFETRAEAEEWLSVMRGKVDGDEFVDKKVAKETTVAEACGWYLDRIAPADGDGKRQPISPWAKNQASMLKFWIGHDEIAGWSLLSVKPWDLIQIVDELREELASQTIVHRLNVLSVVYKEWQMAFRTPVQNPVIEGVRPPLGKGRDRRILEAEEDALLAAAEGSSRPWLRAAIIIAIESGMRQAELSGLTWDRVRLDDEYPHVFLNVTKNGRSRTVPLSERAIEAFTTLKPKTPTIGKVKVFPIETPRAVGHAFRDVVNDVFDDLRWHDLRHEAISRFFEFTDLRDQEIQAIVGHLGAEMLSRYTHLRSARLGARLPKLRAAR